MRKVVFLPIIAAASLFIGCAASHNPSRAPTEGVIRIEEVAPIQSSYERILIYYVRRDESVCQDIWVKDIEGGSRDNWYHVGVLNCRPATEEEKN
jgi:uncharacterized protein YegJ (DUF2314 family)